MIRLLHDRRMDFRFDTVTLGEQLTGSAQAWRRQCQPAPLSRFL